MVWGLLPRNKLLEFYALNRFFKGLAQEALYKDINIDAIVPAHSMQSPTYGLLKTLKKWPELGGKVQSLEVTPAERDIDVNLTTILSIPPEAHTPIHVPHRVSEKCLVGALLGILPNLKHFSVGVAPGGHVQPLPLQPAIELFDPNFPWTNLLQILGLIKLASLHVIFEQRARPQFPKPFPIQGTSPITSLDESHTTRVLLPAAVLWSEADLQYFPHLEHLTTRLFNHYDRGQPVAPILHAGVTDDYNMLLSAFLPVPNTLKTLSFAHDPGTPDMQFLEFTTPITQHLKTFAALTRLELPQDVLLGYSDPQRNSAANPAALQLFPPRLQTVVIWNPSPKIFTWFRDLYELVTLTATLRSIGGHALRQSIVRLRKVELRPRNPPNVGQWEASYASLLALSRCSSEWRALQMAGVGIVLSHEGRVLLRSYDALPTPEEGFFLMMMGIREGFLDFQHFWRDIEPA
ncbi:hypothetical protein K458DRAFT_393855 [Lentithecium fluviatile CBS 122367]|uniref:Uncharacterized protein n=1 Tax=Lentithecium fluviatile CBS 122367 TaxID=1168545 RepID=A0A6G1IN73_9PLEO|nr:hypothetical protein K458DRAFT_393855 [Lentithecium fluviatile CBS 122367]